MEFHPAFKSKQDVEEAIKRREEERRTHPKRQNPIGREQVFAAGENLLRGVDVRRNLRLIYRWKLNSFLCRFSQFKTFPDGIHEPTLNAAIEAAQKAIQNPSDKDLVRAAVEAFCEMRGVKVPVASAFLTAMDPEQFTVIDRRAFAALGARFRAGIADYLDYLWFCRGEAARLGVGLNDLDRALWQRGGSRQTHRDDQDSRVR